MKRSGRELAAWLEGYDDAWFYVENANVLMDGGEKRVFARVEYRDDAPPLFHVGYSTDSRQRPEVFTADAFLVGTIASVELTDVQESDVREMIQLIEQHRALEQERERLQEAIVRTQGEISELERRNGIAQVVADRKITYLTHVTRIQNLPSILRHGLLSRDKLGDLGDEVTLVNDLKRFDGRLSSISLSITHPNDPLFIKWHTYEYPNDLWVVLLLRAAILWELPCSLFLFNSAASVSGLVNASGAATGQDLERLFRDFDSRSGLARATLGYEPYDTTSEQAEVMVEASIPTEYLVAVAVQDGRNVDWLVKWLEKRVATDLIPRVLAEPALFSPRRFVHRRRNAISS